MNIRINIYDENDQFKSSFDLNISPQQLVENVKEQIQSKIGDYEIQMMLDSREMTDLHCQIRQYGLRIDSQIHVYIKSKTVNIEVIFPNNLQGKFVIACRNTMTTRDLIDEINRKVNIEKSNVSLLFGDRTLKSHMKLIDQGVTCNCSITVISKVRGG